MMQIFMRSTIIQQVEKAALELEQVLPQQFLLGWQLDEESAL